MSKKIKLQKKRIITLTRLMCLLIACTLCMGGCGKKKKDDDKATIDIEAVPEGSQMRAIAELATTDCYYHNVAKFTEKNATGHLWWKKDKKFWVEYSGVVTIGIDVSRLSIEVEGDKVTIYMPDAKVLDIKVDEASLTSDAFVVDSDSASIDADDQTEAFRVAQEYMRSNAENDTVLLTNARQRAEELLTEYVDNLGDAVGKKYSINWVYIDRPKAEQIDVEQSN